VVRFAVADLPAAALAAVDFSVAILAAVDFAAVDFVVFFVLAALVVAVCAIVNWAGPNAAKAANRATEMEITIARKDPV